MQLVLPCFETKSCAIAGCDRGGRIVRGWCSVHYGRWRVHGDPLAVPKRVHRYGSDAMCAVEDCSKRARCKGWCDAHWQRYRKHGDPLGGNPSPAVGKVIDYADGSRSCTACDRRLPLDQFDLDRNASGGRRSQCKACRSAKVSRWYADNQDRQRLRQRARAAANRETLREDNRARYKRERERRIEYANEAVHRRRARMADRECEPGLTVKALRKRDGDLCHYCHITMDFTPSKGRAYRPALATLEHLIPISRGGHHVSVNVVLACWRCNCQKNAKTPDEWAPETRGASPLATSA